MKFKKMFWLNEDGEKNIEDAIVNDEIKKAFLDFVRLIKDDNWAVIGGLAVSTYTLPRSTQDVDIIVLGDIDLNPLKPIFKIKRIAVEHRPTQVEIEILNGSEFNNVSPVLIKKCIDTAKIQDVCGKKVKIVTPKMLTALKLKRATMTNHKAKQDQADIQHLLKNYGIQDLKDVDLSEKERDMYKQLIKDELGE